MKDDLKSLGKTSLLAKAYLESSSNLPVTYGLLMSHKSLFQTKNISRMLVGSLLPFCSFLLVAMPAHAEEQMYNFTVTNNTEKHHYRTVRR